MPRLQKLVKIDCVEGWSVKALWEGIPLADLFELVSPMAEVDTVFFHASDGYTTSLPIDVILKRNLIIADTINEITLPSRERLSVSASGRGQVGLQVDKVDNAYLNSPTTRTSVASGSSAGYSNKADVDGPMFGR